jgi:DNA (cytosine-5)-methyltransferase 1
MSTRGGVLAPRRLGPKGAYIQSQLPFFAVARRHRNPSTTETNPYLHRLSTFRKHLLDDPPFKLISLFCGGGGMDVGLSFAGFGTRVASDVAPAFVDTVTANLPHANGCKEDALSLTRERLLDLAGDSEIDLVAAGPPCQSFSILGRRGALDDPRGKLALKYFDLIAAIRPRAFIFENVPGLLTVNKGEDWRRLVRYATKATGYTIFPGKLNAATFGIPQFRERVFLVGFREPASFEFPTRPSGPLSEELLAALAADQMEGSPSKWALTNVEDLANHKIRPHGDRVRTRYTKIKPGDRDRTDHTDRIDPNRPCGTVLVGSGAGGGRPHIHPTEHRVITVREAARLQSFPDWYEFQGTATAQYRQVGNAVPPLLVYEVGKKIAETLNSQNR